MRRSRLWCNGVVFPNKVTASLHHIDPHPHSLFVSEDTVCGNNTATMLQRHNLALSFTVIVNVTCDSGVVVSYM